MEQAGLTKELGYLFTHLGLVRAAVLYVTLHLLHGVGHIESTVPPLMDSHNVLCHLPVHHVVRLVDHDVHKVKPATPHMLAHHPPSLFIREYKGLLPTKYCHAELMTCDTWALASRVLHKYTQ
jgi:hypothetical protein